MKSASRIAFDMHGVLDSYAHIREIANMVYYDDRKTMIILTGQLFDKQMQQKIKKHNILFNEYYSITQYLIDNYADNITWIDGKPFVEDDLWNSAKAAICAQENIDLLYDDSTEYGKYFNEIDTMYIQLHNGKWLES